MPTWLETPLLSKSLDSQSLDKHRAMVGFELEVLSKKVDRFGWDRDRNTPAQDRQMTDWMDALQDYGLAEVQRACKQAIEENPNKCPNEGHVKGIIIRNRGKELQALPKPVEASAPRSEPDEESKARVAKLVAGVGENMRVAK